MLKHHALAAIIVAAASPFVAFSCRLKDHSRIVGIIAITLSIIGVLTIGLVGATIKDPLLTITGTNKERASVAEQFYHLAMRCDHHHYYPAVAPALMAASLIYEHAGEQLERPGVMIQLVDIHNRLGQKLQAHAIENKIRQLQPPVVFKPGYSSQLPSTLNIDANYSDSLDVSSEKGLNRRLAFDKLWLPTASTVRIMDNPSWHVGSFPVRHTWLQKFAFSHPFPFSEIICNLEGRLEWMLYSLGEWLWSDPYDETFVLHGIWRDQTDYDISPLLDDYLALANYYQSLGQSDRELAALAQGELVCHELQGNRIFSKRIANQCLEFQERLQGR